ncbi:MAG: hypothetical protein R3C56_37420 [Pirellulaceae bacterium]
MTVAGPLNVTGEAIGPNQPGWNVVGDELQLATNSAGQVDMQISGKPARITLGEEVLGRTTHSLRSTQQFNLPTGSAKGAWDKSSRACIA